MDRTTATSRQGPSGGDGRPPRPHQGGRGTGPVRHHPRTTRASSPCSTRRAR